MQAQQDYLSQRELQPYISHKSVKDQISELEDEDEIAEPDTALQPIKGTPLRINLKLAEEEANEEQRNTLLNKTSASKLSIEQEEADMVVTSMVEAFGASAEEKEIMKRVIVYSESP